MTNTETFETLSKAKKVAIFGHVNPDADAYGSMFAMREFLREQGKAAEVFAVRGNKCFLDEIFPLEEVKTDFAAKDFDLVLCLDMHSINRPADIFVEQIRKAKKVVVIDHHVVSGKEELICKDVFSLPEKAATCEILTDLMRENKVKISPKIATYLWAGLIGDTGRFLHSNLTENVLKVAQVLKHAGADDQFVYDKMFHSTTMKQLKLQKFFLNKIVFNDGYAYCIISQKDLKKLAATKHDFDIFAGEMRNFEGVEVSFFATETSKNFFELSLRTNGKNSLIVSVPNGGGGHKCASGCDFAGTAKQLKKKIPIWAKEILSEGN